jgi:hypothetical protein
VLRLFSVFPQRAPGIALLLLRCSVAAGLLSHSGVLWARVPRLAAVVSVLLALLLGIGFLTPLLSWLCCLLEGAAILADVHGNADFLLLSIVNSAALALLGPGAYSVDARLFGRRAIVFPPSEDVQNRGRRFS